MVRDAKSKHFVCTVLVRVHTSMGQWQCLEPTEEREARAALPFFPFAPRHLTARGRTARMGVRLQRAVVFARWPSLRTFEAVVWP